MDFLPTDLTAITTALQGRLPRTRFAPSPTGYLHIGHVVNAAFVWGIARALGGEVVLRLEDHDRTRCKPAYETALLQDLATLGLIPDIGLAADFLAGPCDFRQSDCDAHYRAALAQLSAQGLVYACDCSRQSIRARTGQPDYEELSYDGHCRDRGLPFAPGSTVRVRLDAGEVEFWDALAGTCRQEPAAQCGDIAVIDRNGCWTYQFAVVVDDLRHGINLVIRGVDIAPSTGRQIALGRLLGMAAPPVYLHHGLLTDAAGRKLSKRDFDADIHSLFEGGMPGADVLGLACHQAGLLQAPGPLSAAELPGCFMQGAVALT
jgi:glutamyl-Q tRNA(Asp) synthetase